MISRLSSSKRLTAISLESLSLCGIGGTNHHPPVDVDEIRTDMIMNGHISSVDNAVPPWKGRHDSPVFLFSVVTINLAKMT